MTPDRFKLAREVNRLTQADLVRRVEEVSGRKVSQSTIAEIETGRLVPSSDLATAIALASGFPLEFFEQGELGDFPSGSLVMYRAKAAVTAKEEAQVRRHAQLLVEVVTKLSRRIDLLPTRIPQLSESPPVEAAQLTRTALGLSPDGPVANLVRSMEAAGVLVLALPIGRDPVDAFSVWFGREQTPCVAILKDAPADRQRWTMAHELGHIVMHRAMRRSMAFMEDEADRFAAELLTPQAAMESELTAPLTLVALRDLKARWRVSMRSLINRAAEVGVVTARQRSYLFMKMNSIFGGKSEPVMFLPERPRGLRQMFEMIYGLPIDFDQAAFELNLSAERLQLMLENYQGSQTVENTQGKVINFEHFA